MPTTYDNDGFPNYPFILPVFYNDRQCLPYTNYLQTGKDLISQGGHTIYHAYR